ncbi:MoxR family ATPase [Actinomadura citrea]|uniref:AAA family ATPase n=1 Tax=Actinomadura TaxID=1988 RepID=UPI002E2D2FAF|nr:MoxR family ATPase [Actinomadura citrea]
MAADEPPEVPSPRDAPMPAGPGDAAPDARAAWWIYRGTGRPLPQGRFAAALPPPPPWRAFDGGPPLPPPPGDERDLVRRLGPVSARPRPADPAEVDAVNAAVFLRRPLLVTGEPGVGKSTLAYRITRELGLGRVLRWPIGSRSTLRDGLYEYDAIGRAQDAATGRGALARQGGELSEAPVEGDPDSAALTDAGVGHYLRLGPLGTALLPHELPRVLLIDELDKSDIDLPNDLLDVLEEGEYGITELFRVSAREPVVKVHTADPDGTADIVRGRVRCRAFPIVVITSNGEREFPPAFLRRCLQFSMKEPDETRLADIVAAHFAERSDERTRRLVRSFLEHRSSHRGLAADQLLNAVYLATSGARDPDTGWERLLDLIWQRLEVAPE